VNLRIALVWPYGYDTEYVMPLSLGYLKGNISKKHDVRIIDCSFLGIKSPGLEKIFEEFRPEVVGVSSWSPMYEEAIRVVKLAKSIDSNATTIIGGAHATSYPDHVLQNPDVDFVMRGEAEFSFTRFIEELENGKNWNLVPGLAFRSKKGITKNDFSFVTDIDKISIPDYDAINLEGYLKAGYRFSTSHKRNAPVWITRGCPYRCSFCSAGLLNGKIIRKHSIAYMLNMVKHLYHEKGIRYINIIDDNFTFHVEYAKDFCKAVKELNLKDLRFGTPNGIRAQRTDPELFKLMKDAGWEYLVIAPESGSLDTLKRMNKDLDPKIFPEKIREIKEAGLKVHGFFIIGYPGETDADLKQTSILLRKCKLNFFFLNNFQPLPGTPVYDELVKNGEIEDGLLPKNYSSGERVYVPKGLKDFNFAKFVLKEYLYLLFSNPLNIPYVIKVIGPRMIWKKAVANLRSMVSA